MIKILIDENIDINLAGYLSDFNIYTVSQMNWRSKKNGELIKLAADNNFTHLLTIDKNLQHQQNLEKYPINFILLNTPNSKIDTLIKFIPHIINFLKGDPDQKLMIIDL